MGGQPSPAVQAVARALGEELRNGPRTLNELRDWWVKDNKGDAGAFQDAAKYLIGLGLVEPRNLGKVKMLALAGQHHKPSKGSAIVRDATVRDPDRGPGDEAPAERALRLERAADRPFSSERLHQAQLGRDVEASTAAVAPPPLPPPAPPRPSTSAPSPAPAQAAILNNRPVARSDDKPALSPPPAPETPRGKATPSASAGATPAAATHSGPARYHLAPPPEADGTVWLSSERVAEMLGIDRASLAQVGRRESSRLRKRKGPGLEHEQRAPWFYSEASVHALLKERASSPYVHANRGKAIAAAVARDVHRSNAKRAAIDEALAERPEPVEHRRQVAAAGLPRIVLPQGDDVVSLRKQREAIAAEAGYLFVWLPPAPRALLEALLASGMYGDGSAHELAERLLLAELRRHVDMPRLIERSRR